MLEQLGERRRASEQAVQPLGLQSEELVGQLPGPRVAPGLRVEVRLELVEQPVDELGLYESLDDDATVLGQRFPDGLALTGVREAL
jgi:hypothetical protein